MAQHEVEQQMPEGLTTYGDSQLGAVGEVHLRLTARWMLLLEVHLAVGSMKRPVVADPTLKRPQLGPSEPARAPLLEPLQDSCRRKLTLRVGQ